MSVLIKGMEMPKNCSTCPCFQYNMFDDDIDGYCKALKTKITDSDKYHPNCQLTEVKTPHGRLIDAAFEEQHYTSMTTNPTPDVTEQDKHNSLVIVRALQMAKTIIEAED